MTTALDIDLATLVGDMPAVPCESAGHHYQSEVHSGPAATYALVNCLACGMNAVKSYCSSFTSYIASGGAVHCAPCFARTSRTELLRITILGPVGGGQ